MMPDATDGAASCAPPRRLSTLTSLLVIFGGGRRADLGRTRFELAPSSAAARSGSSRGFTGPELICCRLCSGAAISVCAGSV